MTDPDQRRLTMADHYDAELARLYARFLAATRIEPTDRVLDVGCGTGQTTRDAARAARRGSALGIDVSEQMIVRARRLATEEGLTNVAYELGDAQVHRFAAAHFDIVISRFGTMFFTDPVAAFSNLAGAARPGARLVMMVWQAHDRNEWATAIRRTLTAGTGLPTGLSTGPPSGADAFSLAGPSVVESLLSAAGFVDVGFTDVDEPVYYGPTATFAYDLVSSLRTTGDLLENLGAAEADRAVARLRAMLAARDSGQGIWFDSRAWIITARRRE